MKPWRTALIAFVIDAALVTVFVLVGRRSHGEADNVGGIVDTLSQMMESNAGRLLVMRNDQLEGIISRESILRVVQRKVRTRLPA